MEKNNLITRLKELRLEQRLLESRLAALDLQSHRQKQMLINKKPQPHYSILNQQHWLGKIPNQNHQIENQLFN